MDNYPTSRQVSTSSLNGEELTELQLKACRYIHWYEQIIYIPTYHGDQKFNIYLLYSASPKNDTKNYSIHIDAFDKTLLTYRASWHLPIRFQFLPVHRISSQLIIARERLPTGVRSCGHCIFYLSMQMNYFVDTIEVGQDHFVLSNITVPVRPILYALTEASVCAVSTTLVHNECLVPRSLCQNEQCMCKWWSMCTDQSTYCQG